MAEDNRERMTKALDTMLLELQVPRQIVSPILRKLLQTYENEWDHIEADGYRVLADAIFQHQEQMDKKMSPGPSSVMPPKGKGKKKSVNQGGSRRQCSQRASKEIVHDSSSESESSGEDHDDREYAPNSLEADRSYADRGNGAFRRSPPRGIAMRGAIQNRCGEGGRREVLCQPVRKLKQPLEKATESAGGRMEGAVCGRELLCQSSQKLKHAFDEDAVPVPGRSRVEGPPGSSVGNAILPVLGQKSPSPNVPTTLCKPLTALRPPLPCLPCGGNCVFDKVKFEVLDEESPQEVFRELPKEAPAHHHQEGISSPVLQQSPHGVLIKALMAGQPTVQNDNLIASTPKVTQVHAASLIPSRIEASHASVVRNGMVGIEAPLDVATTDLKPTMVGKLAPIHDACKGKFPIDKFKIERLAEYPLQKVACTIQGSDCSHAGSSHSSRQRRFKPQENIRTKSGSCKGRKLKQTQQ